MTGPAPRALMILGAGALSALLLLTAAACGATPKVAGAAMGHASTGSMSLRSGYLPKPATPGLGAAYFVLVNGSDRPDRLIGARSSEAGTVVVMRDVTRENVATMVPLAGLVIPAHGRVVLAPGGNHLMLQSLNGGLQVGDRVRLVLRFEHAGSMRVTLPVTSLSSTGGMSPMPGM